MMATADLSAYRPVTQFINFENFPVPEAVETDAKLGPGIRINGDDDNASGTPDYSDSVTAAGGDDDLVRVDVAGSEGVYTISWTGPLTVWTTPTKGASIANGAAGAVSPGQSIWVEYANQTHTTSNSLAALTLSVTDFDGTATDTVAFHSFRSIVVAIGGFTEDPRQFGDPNLGVFTMAGTLYSQGYDVHLFSENQVPPTGLGVVYNEIVSAVHDRNAAHVAIYGHSWGAGATYELSRALQANRDLRRDGYRLDYTGYIDAIHHGNIEHITAKDVKSERRKPAGTHYHDNYYQRLDPFLRGNSVLFAHNVNVNKTSWGRTLVHITIDNDPTVQSIMLGHLTSRVTV